MKFLRWLLIIVTLLAALVVALAYAPGGLEAERFAPTPPDPALMVRLEAAPVEPEIVEGDFYAAEDLEPGPDGRLYASLEDGRILARTPQGAWSEVADTGGRPLGLSFGPQGRLHVADALAGVLRLERDGAWTVLAEAGAYPDFVFADDLEVLPDGTVIVTDASGRHGTENYMTSLWEGERTGRVIRLDPSGGREVLLDDLAFANGVAFDPETNTLFIAETWAARIHALDPQTGDSRVILDGLPSYPDNLHWDASAQRLWIALPSSRSALMEFLHPLPSLKRMAWRVTRITGEPRPAAPVAVFAADRDGHVRETLIGSTRAGTIGATTAVLWEGRIWTGGLDRTGVEAYPMPAERTR